MGTKLEYILAQLKAEEYQREGRRHREHKGGGPPLLV